MVAKSWCTIRTTLQSCVRVENNTHKACKIENIISNVAKICQVQEPSRDTRNNTDHENILSTRNQRVVQV